ncbi:MAG TPA: DUF2798 domain-containing protein [Methylophilus sp.]
MRKKIPYRFRTMTFAGVMSCCTALIVSGIIIYLRGGLTSEFVSHWLAAFTYAWPIVFVSILLIAPAVNKLLDYCVEQA